MEKKRKSVSYAKWGYVFILPFFLCYFIFSLIPLADTIRYSFFEYYRSGIKEIGHYPFPSQSPSPVSLAPG